MTDKKPFGLWPSPISIESLSAAKRINDVKQTDTHTLYVEGRGAESVIVAVPHTADAPFDVTDGISVRGGVGYGGGEFDVRDDTVACASDGRIFIAKIGKGLPRPITPKHGNVASPSISPDGKWVAYVHTDGSRDVIAVVDIDGQQWPQVVAQGHDFYMQPSWHPDSDVLVWAAWDHPNMPWDFTVIEKRTIENGRARGDVEVLFQDCASQQPEFSPDGSKLAFVSDASGTWQLYIHDGTTRLVESNGNVGGPAWIQGLRYFAWKTNQEVIATSISNGENALFSVDVESSDITSIDTNYTSIAQVSVVGDRVAFVGSSSQQPPRVIALNAGEQIVVARATSERIESSVYSQMQPKAWTSGDAGEIFGNFYPPHHNSVTSDGLPPAIVMIHGGPTAFRSAAFDARNQFFATRGYAIMDVNYRGSTGYGREYKRALYGQWGIADVEDAVSAAQYLADHGLADPKKIVIMGGSAGGYTVLQALTDHPGVFRAGVCMYGISNLFSLALSTHKFESSYNDVLLGPLPEAADIFRERSPIFKANNIVDPVVVYHGAQDKVVPIDQAEAIVGSLRARKVPHAYHVYENEGHGWRRPENIKHFYETLQQFLLEQVVFG